MGSYKVRRLKLPQNIVDALERQSLNSCKDVLSVPKLELQAMLGISNDKVNNLICEACKKCVSPPQTAYNMHVSQQLTAANGFLPTSLHALDLLLQGGLLLGSITEIAGPPGVGKTQFCFMLSILASLPIFLGDSEGKVIYIDTESAFCAQRIKIIAEKRFSYLFNKEVQLQQLLQNILFQPVNSVNALKEIMPLLEKEIIRHKVKLIIVDSIASLMRKEFGSAGMQSLMERNKLLLEQAAILKDLAQTYSIVVFLTNQIASHVTEIDIVQQEENASDEEDIKTDFQPGFSEVSTTSKSMRGINIDHVHPALGNTWFHCVNTRLVAQFLDSDVRQLTIMKSPVAPNAAVRYTLNEAGVVLTDDDIEFVNVSNQESRSILTKNNFLSPDITGTGVGFSGTSGIS